MTASAEPIQEPPVVIEIDLEDSDSNRQVELKELVQRVCYETLKRGITVDLRNAVDQDHKVREHPASSGLVYFIDGTRGAGKSTFLHFVYRTLPIDLTTVQGPKVRQLAYIDPSRVENSEIILLSVLKSLKRRVEEQTRKSCTLDDERHTSNFRDIFRKLAGGLSLFASSHNPLQDLDAELFLDWGLERAGHSSDLRKYLHQLINTACQMLKVDALVLAFDDADTNSENARNVLECIRKYLDTPQLLILVTGDMELYSLLIRDHFYGSLGKISYKQEKERDEQRTKMVDHLEEQYLLKLFPIRRRVQLRPLWNLVTLTPTIGRSVQYKLKYSNWNVGRNPNTVLDELIRRGLRLKSATDIALYREFLLKQPLRSVLQVLSRCAQYLSASDPDGKKNNEWDAGLSEALSESLRAMALGSLYKLGVDVDGIGAHELPALIEAVFELAVRDGDMDTAAYLRPQPNVPALKNSFAALSADVANLCARKPSSLIQYLFAGPGSVTLYGQVQRSDKESRAGNEGNQRLRTQFKQYMGIGRKEDALNWARHATGILTTAYSANPKSPAVVFGVIGLNKRKPRGVPINAANLFKTVQSAINTCTLGDKPLPVFALSLIDVSGLSSRTYASIYNIVGLMERLLSLEPSEQHKSGILSVISKPYPSLSISRPSWVGENVNIEAEENDVDASAAARKSNKKDHAVSEEDSADPKLSLLCENVERWLKDTDHLRAMQTPSAVMIGKIWTRLYFSLEKVSNDLRGSATTAEIMELFALCVVNAFLVEELDHHLGSSDTGAPAAQASDRTNPRTSAGEFVKKLERISVDHDKLPLTSLIATCPLILGLLSANLKLANQIARMSNELKEKDVLEMLCPKEVWTLIEHTYIAGRKWPEEPKNIVSKQPKKPPAKSGATAATVIAEDVQPTHEGDGTPDESSST